MSEQENIRAAQSFFEAWNAGDLSKTDPYEAEGFMADNPGMAGAVNSVQNRAYLQAFLNAFPGSKFEILQTIAQGDFVVTNWKTSALNNGPLQTPSGGSIPPTGKMVTITGSTTAQLKDGKMIHTWSFWDMSSLLIQLGLMPPM